MKERNGKREIMKERKCKRENGWKTNKEKQIKQVESKSPSWSELENLNLFPVKELPCAIYNFWKNWILLKWFKDLLWQTIYHRFMNIFILLFKYKLAPGGTESAHHSPKSDLDCLFLIKMHSFFSTLWLAQLNCIEQAYVCMENKGSGGK